MDHGVKVLGYFQAVLERRWSCPCATVLLCGTGIVQKRDVEELVSTAGIRDDASLVVIVGNPIAWLERSLRVVWSQLRVDVDGGKRG